MIIIFQRPATGLCAIVNNKLNPPLFKWFANAGPDNNGLYNYTKFAQALKLGNAEYCMETILGDQLFDDVVTEADVQQFWKDYLVQEAENNLEVQGFTPAPKIFDPIPPGTSQYLKDYLSDLGDFLLGLFTGLPAVKYSPDINRTKPPGDWSNTVFQIKFDNSLYEGTTINIPQWALDEAISTTSMPPPAPTTITAMNSQALIWTQDSWSYDCACGAFMAIQTPKGFLAVAIMFNGAMFHIEETTKPYYLIWHDDSGQPIPPNIQSPFLNPPAGFWTVPVTDPAESWTFPDTVGWQVTINVTNSSEASLILDVNITDLS